MNVTLKAMVFFDGKWPAAIRLGLAGLMTVTSLGEAPARAEDGPPREPGQFAALDLTWWPGAVEAPQIPPDLEGVQATQGQIAFQSFRDGNWEIYLGSSDTLSVRRLTADPAPDVEPRLSPDMTRVVFESKRTGNYELFSIDATGNGLRQLTNDPGSDAAATWSPDGRRIAFQSNRSGNSDIYVMNADGSGLARLTTNADYDGEPAWSPDGAEIAFVSRRTPGDVDYFLYVMNADGTGQRLLTAVPYSSHPTWSPRGRRILMDGLDSTGWQRLYVYDVVANSARTVGPATQPNTDDYAGSWGVNDTFYFTRVEYVQDSGQWYILRMQVLSAAEGSTANAGYVFGDVDGYPSWRNPDHVPPTSFIYSGDTYLRQGTSPILWGVALDDSASGGVAGVETQSRVDGAAWDNQSNFGCLKSGAISWKCLMKPVAGTQYDARLRGVDTYDNREDWATETERWVRIRVYQRQILGIVTDQAGVGLARLVLQGPTVMNSDLITDDGGRILGYQASATPFTLSATVGGQTASVVSDRLQVLGGGDLWADLRPAPIGNVLGNAGFDTAGAAWSTVNTGAPQWLSAVAANADSPSLRLGWPDSLIDPPFNGYNPIVGYSGTTEIVLLNQFVSTNLIVCPGQSACAVEPLGNDLARAMAVGPDGTVAVLFTNGYYQNPTFRLRSPSGVWSTPEAAPDFLSSNAPQLVPDGQGNWILLGTDAYGLLKLSRRTSAGVWSSPVDVLMFFGSWQAVIDSSDVVHVIGCGSGGILDITWSADQGVGQSNVFIAGGCDPRLRTALVDAADQIYAVVSMPNGELHYHRRSAAGVWGAAVPLTGQTFVGSSVVSGPNGRPLVAVAGADGGWLFYAAAATGTAWEPLPRRINWAALSASSRLIGYNTAGDSITVLEPDYGGTLERRRLMSLENASGVRQVVTIPSDLHQPWLSTYYRFKNAAVGDTLRLGIQGAGDASPTYLPLPGGDGWQRGWRNVSAWAGQEVTVTLELTDGPAAGSPVADIDEVYLGAYTTPSVTSVSPSAVVTSAGTLTVTGANFMEGVTITIDGGPVPVTRLDANHLSLTLPPGLLIGPHALIVTNPGGYAALAQQAVQVGYVLTLPSLLRWMPPS